MDVIYNDLLAILDHVEGGSLPEGISPANLRYIKTVIECAVHAETMEVTQVG